MTDNLSAEDRIRKVRISFLRENPFFANISLYLNLIEMKNMLMPTMGIDYEGNLYFDPDFVKGLSFGELKGVIAHETCLVPETFVWNKKISEIKTGDKILGDDGKEHEVISTNERKYEGELICITPRGSLPIKITSNHPILTTSGSWKGFRKPNYRKLENRIGENKFIFDKFVWKGAKDVTLNDWLVIPKIKSIEKYENYIIKFKFGNEWSIRLKKCIKEGLKLDEDVAYFLGLYTADGCANIKSKNICIALHSEKDKEKTTKVKGIIENKMGFKVRVKKRDDSNCVNVIFSSRPFTSFLHENIGTRAGNKKIPEFIIFNNDEIKKAYLKGFIDGDGYNNHINIGFATISENLAHQLFMLSASLGIIFNMYKERRSTKSIWMNKVNKKWCDIYIFFSRCHKIYDVLNLPHIERTIRKTKFFKEYENYILVRVRKIQKEKYNGMVYNLQTENQNYTANNITVHNCHLALFHLLRKGSRDKELWNVSCFTPNMILGGDFIPIGNATEKNIIIEKNGNVDNIKTILKREYNGDIFKIKAIGAKEIEATPEHPFLVLKRKSYKSGRRNYPIKFGKELEWIKAENLNKDCYLVTPKIKGNIKIKKLNLIKYIKYNKKIREIKLNNEIAWLMGLYVAEGSNGGKGILKLNLGFNDRKYLKKIYNINKKNFKVKIKKYEIPNKKNIMVNLYSSILQRAFEDWFGRGAKNKKIPDFIFYNENIEIIKYFLEGYVDGDGHRYTKNNSSITVIETASEKLAFQVQSLLTRLNIFGCYHRYERPKRIFRKQILPKQISYEIKWRIFKKMKRLLNGKLIDSHSYQWRDMGEYFITPIKKIERVKYYGFVYNTETNSHTYLINNVVVHNCDLAINLILQEQDFRLPRGVLLSDEFKDMSAEQIYDELYKKAKKITVHNDGQGNVTIGNISGKQFDKHFYPKKGEDGGDGGSGKKDKDYKGKGEEDSPLSEREIKKLEDEWKKRIVEASSVAKMMGSMPAGLERMIGTLLEPKINWKALLYRYVTNEIISDVSYSRPHKKSESVGVYLPHTVKENVEIAVSVDSSGCLVSDTLIYTEDGIKEIRELENEKIINSDFDINKIDSVNKKFSFTAKKLIKIQTKSGREIICTPNHKIFVYNYNYIGKTKLNKTRIWLKKQIKRGGIIEKRADELKIDDFLFAMQKINYPQNEIKMPDINYNYKFAPTSEQIENVKKLSYKHSGYEIAKLLKLPPTRVYRILQNKKTRRNNKQPVIPDFINKDFAQLMGYICGDGNISISTSGHLAYITVTDKTLENLEHYKHIAEKFEINSRIWIRKDRRKKLNLFSKDFALYIKQNFPEIICKSRQRIIPRLITKSKDDVIIGFLRGLFDAEGHIGNHDLIISNTSEKLLKQSQLLLNRLGIYCYVDSSITPERYIGLYRLKETKLFHLKMGGLENMKLFYNLIGVTRKDKKEKIENMIKEIKINMNRTNIKYNDFLSLEKIKSIEIIEKNEEIEVFDLEIVNNHNYFANGILVHNSIGESEINEFISEIIGISRSFANLNMTLLVCDAKVHDVYEIRNGFDPKDIKIRGGGGTDALPIVRWLEQNKPYTKLWIYLTDGCTQLNGGNPFKSLWVISKNGSLQSAEQVAKKAGNITCMKTDE